MARTKFSELREAVEARPGARERLVAERAETLRRHACTSSPSKPAPYSTRCSEPNGTVPLDPARQANGHNLSPGPTLRPVDHCRASACSSGDLPRVRHHRSPCPQQRSRDCSLDRAERSKHSNGYRHSGDPCLPDIPGPRHADAHRLKR